MCSTTRWSECASDPRCGQSCMNLFVVERSYQCSFVSAGCDACRDKAGREGGQTERDQTRTAELAETQGEVCSVTTPKSLNVFRLKSSAVTQTYFEDNPRDFQLLRHDKDLHPAVVKPHMKNVPDYLSKT